MPSKPSKLVAKTIVGSKNAGRKVLSGPKTLKNKAGQFRADVRAQVKDMQA